MRGTFIPALQNQEPRCQGALATEGECARAFLSPVTELFHIRTLLFLTCLGMAGGLKHVPGKHWVHRKCLTGPSVT